MCHSTGCAIVNKIKLLFIYVIFCFNYQTIASPTVRIACTKLRIYELTDSELEALNYEFTNSQIGYLCAINYEFTNWEIVNCKLKPRIYELTDRWIVCDKAYFDLKNFRPWELTHELLALIPLPFISPTHSTPYPARHIPSFGFLR